MGRVRASSRTRAHRRARADPFHEERSKRGFRENMDQLGLMNVLAQFALPPVVLVIAAALALALGTLLLVTIMRQLLYIARPNEALIFSGKRYTTATGEMLGYKVVRKGRRSWRIPVIERVDPMDMTLIPADVARAPTRTRRGTSRFRSTRSRTSSCTAKTSSSPTRSSVSWASRKKRFAWSRSRRSRVRSARCSRR